MIRDLQNGKFKKPIVNLHPMPEEDKGKKTALVLSGAGAKILIECGAAEAVQDLVTTSRMRELDCLIGSSSGALTAAFYAANQLDVLHHLCLTMKNKDIYTWTPWNMFNGNACVLSNDPLRKTIKDNLDFSKIRKFGNKGERAVFANVTSLDSWTSYGHNLCTLSDEQALDALVKSTSVPGAFSVKDGYCDGGVVDNYPIFDAIAQQADRIILVVSSGKDPMKVGNLKDMIAQFISIVMYNQLESARRILELVHVRNPNIQLTELIEIEPKKPTGIALLDADGLGTVEQRESFIKLGYDLAMEALKDVNDDI